MKGIGAGQTAVLRRAMSPPSEATHSALKDLIRLVADGFIAIHDAVPVFVQHLSATKLAVLQLADPDSYDAEYLPIHAITSLHGLCALVLDNDKHGRNGKRPMPLSVRAAADRAVIALSVREIWGWARYFFLVARSTPIQEPSRVNVEFDVVFFTFALLEHKQFIIPDAVELLLAALKFEATHAAARQLFLQLACDESYLLAARLVMLLHTVTNALESSPDHPTWLSIVTVLRGASKLIVQVGFSALQVPVADLDDQKIASFSAALRLLFLLTQHDDIVSCDEILTFEHMGVFAGFY
jgi:hypothetical protein